MRAVFAGTFDPPTLGHLDVIKRCRALFSELYVVIAENTTKKPLLSVEERIYLFNKIFESMNQDAASKKHKLIVTKATGLVAELCKEIKADYFIRGVRSTADLERELPMSVANEMLSGGLTTLLIPSTKENSFVSSSLVREISFMKGDISSFVPQEIDLYLKSTAKVKEKKQVKQKKKVSKK